MINSRNDVTNYSLFTIAIRKDKCGYSMEQLTRYCRKNLKYSYKQIISAYKSMIDLKLERIEDWDSDDELVQRKLSEIKEYKMEISRIKKYLKDMKAAKEAKELKSIHEIKSLSDDVSVVYGD